jgi:oligopeptide transport system permease protein
MNYKVKMILGSSILGGLIILCLVGSLISPYEPTAICLIDKNSPPSFSHWFGTDELGRDLLARTLQGMRISLSIGALAGFIDLLLGTLWGTIAGFSNNKVDAFMMRLAELVYSLPYVLVVILASVILGKGIIPLLVAMICIGWIHMARVIRLLVREARCAEYVLAAHALGVRTPRLFFTHIFPNIAGPMLVACMLSVPHAIFTEAFLSFLGIGIQPPTASLGSLIGDALPAMRFFPWRLIFPASFISLLIFSIMLLSDGLRDLYDPKKQLNRRGGL